VRALQSCGRAHPDPMFPPAPTRPLPQAHIQEQASAHEKDREKANAEAVESSELHLYKAHLLAEAARWADLVAFLDADEVHILDKPTWLEYRGLYQLPCWEGGAAVRAGGRSVAERNPRRDNLCARIKRYAPRPPWYACHPYGVHAALALAKLKRAAEAELCYRELIELNTEGHAYHYALQDVLGIKGLRPPSSRNVPRAALALQSFPPPQLRCLSPP